MDSSASHNPPNDVSISIPSESKPSKKTPHVTVLCLNITDSSPTVQLLICSTAVFGFYLLYGYLQEKLFRLEGFKDFGWYLTFIQFAFYASFSAIESVIKHGRIPERRIPWRQYSLLAAYTVGTMGLSNASVGYLNYPTQVIFKCCKLIPVLIGGILIQGKRYGALDVAAAICMSAGLVWFSLVDSQVSPKFELYGYILISGALVFDAIIGNVQEKEMKRYGATNNEMVLYSYGIGCVYILFVVTLSGELINAFVFCIEHPTQYAYAALFSAAGYFGVNIVLTLVTRFGALIAVTVTTCRKAVTIILSFIFFAKPFTMQYVWSGIIVLIGIYLNVYSKNKSNWDAVLIDTMQKSITYCQQLKLWRRRASQRHVEMV